MCYKIHDSFSLIFKEFSEKKQNNEKYLAMFDFFPESS